MSRLVALKLLRLVLLMFIVTAAVFVLVSVVPGDLAISVLGSEATLADYERVREELNLDAPIWERYASWLGDAVTGDLGNQLTNQGFTVIERIQQTFPVTLEIAALSMIIALLVSIPLGIFAALYQGRFFDRFSSGTAFAAIALPSFLLGLLLKFFFVDNDRQDISRNFVVILILFVAAWLIWRALAQLVAKGSKKQNYSTDFSLAIVVIAVAVAFYVWWPDDFKSGGFARLTSDEGLLANLRDALLPALTIAITEIAVFMRLLRSDIASTLQEDFILAARTRGLSRQRILFRHALRPSSFSLITLAGVSFGRAIGGTVIVETVFKLPGMGTFIVNQGVNLSDYNVVLGGVVVFTTAFMLLNTSVDIAYNYLDPRIRRGRR